MDKAIDENKLKKNKRLLIFKYSIIVLSIFIVTLVFRSVTKESVKRSNLVLYTAEVGSVINTVSTIGYLHPEYEEVVMSALSTTVSKVYFMEGTIVKKGDTIISLDRNEVQNQILNQRNVIELEKNKIAKLSLELKKNHDQLKVQDKIKLLEIQMLKSNKENAEKLFKIGGGTYNDVKKIEDELKIMKLKKDQSELDLITSQNSKKISLQEAYISLRILEQGLINLKDNLGKSAITSPLDGVLTYINNQIGDKVNEGEMLLKVADLSKYMVKATISDSYVEDILLGMDAYIQIRNDKFYGKISSINPEIKNNEISFNLKLDIPKNKVFNPKMQVDVFIINDHRFKTIRVGNGSAFMGSKSNEIFVLKENNTAHKINIEIGLTNKDYVEIINGISEGDNVIISGLEDINNIDKIEITD